MTPVPDISAEWRIRRHFSVSGKQYQGVITVRFTIGDEESKVEFLTTPRDDYFLVKSEINIVLRRLHDQLINHLNQQLGDKE